VTAHEPLVVALAPCPFRRWSSGSRGPLGDNTLAHCWFRLPRARAPPGTALSVSERRGLEARSRHVRGAQVNSALDVADTEPSPPPTELRCEIVRNGHAAWVQPFGELDLDTVHRVDAALEELRGDGCPEVVLDLRGLTFMDSTGLRLVIRWDTTAREDGFQFAIVPGRDVVQRVFRLTGMDAHLTVAEPPSGS
jgi:anti-anti-sigma factor